MIKAIELCSTIESEFDYLISKYGFTVIKKQNIDITENDKYKYYNVIFANEYILLDIGYYFEKNRDSFYYFNIYPISFDKYSNSTNELTNLVNETMTYPFLNIVRIINPTEMEGFYNISDYNSVIKKMAALFDQYGNEIIYGDFELFKIYNINMESTEFDDW